MKLVLMSAVAAALAGLPLLAAMAQVPAKGGPPKGGESAFPFAVEEKTLPNGLRVFVVQFDSPELVAYYSVVRTGSRNEIEPGKSGFAHFFEHMMFRGTARYPTDKYNDALKAIGADSNAYTSDDLTVYHILAGKAALGKIVDLEADRFRNLEYKEPEFQKEARAVLGEYNKSASNPFQKMHEELMNAAFEKHTYKHTTMGFLRDIEDMPKQLAYSRQFFDRYYRPDNVVLIVAGDVTGTEVFPLVERHYAGWKRGPARPMVPAEPPQQKEKRIALDWKGATLPMLFMGFHTPAFSTRDADGAALEVLGELLFSKRAVLYQKLVITEQKVEAIYGGNDAHVDPHLFNFLVRVKKPEDLAYVESAIVDEIARIGREGVDARTLGDTIAHIKYAFAAGLDTADHLANVASGFIGLTGSLASIDEYYALFPKVTSAGVQRVANRYFSPKNKTVVSLKSKEAAK